VNICRFDKYPWSLGSAGMTPVSHVATAIPTITPECRELLSPTATPPKELAHYFCITIDLCNNAIVGKCLAEFAHRHGWSTPDHHLLASPSA
jgi:hypothetical protein